MGNVAPWFLVLNRETPSVVFLLTFKYFVILAPKFVKKYIHQKRA